MRTVLHTESSPGLGGQEIRTLNEARWIGERGWRVIVAGQPDGRFVTRAREAGLETAPRAHAVAVGPLRGRAAHAPDPRRARERRAHAQLGRRLARRARGARGARARGADPPRLDPRPARLQSRLHVAGGPRHHERRGDPADHRGRGRARRARGRDSRRRRPRRLALPHGARPHGRAGGLPNSRLSPPVIGSRRDVPRIEGPRASARGIRRGAGRPSDGHAPARGRRHPPELGGGARARGGSRGARGVHGLQRRRAGAPRHDGLLRPGVDAHGGRAPVAAAGLRRRRAGGRERHRRRARGGGRRGHGPPRRERVRRGARRGHRARARRPAGGRPPGGGGARARRGALLPRGLDQPAAPALRRAPGAAAPRCGPPHEGGAAARRAAPRRQSLVDGQRGSRHPARSRAPRAGPSGPPRAHSRGALRGQGARGRDRPRAGLVPRRAGRSARAPARRVAPQAPGARRGSGRRPLPSLPRSLARPAVSGARRARADVSQCALGVAPLAGARALSTHRWRGRRERRDRAPLPRRGPGPARALPRRRRRGGRALRQGRRGRARAPGARARRGAGDRLRRAPRPPIAATSS